MPTSTKVLGYYRCSDILFNWANALPKNSDDTQVLRDILLENALLHPGHPLHEKGTDGINTFLGKFANGKTRHLFSSAQVEYLRYWLHAVKLTTTILPVPSSESMFLEAEVSAVPRAYPSLKELRNTMKKTRKANSRIKAGGRDACADFALAFEGVRKLWGAQVGTWCALDFELYLGTQDIITEMGFSSVRWEDGQEKEERGHFTVEEHRGYLNGRYKTVERRMNYNAEFGQSVELTKAGLKDTVANLILEMHARGPVFLVFHDARGDIKTLNFLGAPIETAVYALPADTIPAEGIFIVDTQILFGALTLNQIKDRRSLDHVCNRLGIETRFLHNAGNDAEYTLQALREMASGGSVDLQAERRWPDIGATGGDVACQLSEQQTGVNYDLNTGALQDESYTAV